MSLNTQLGRFLERDPTGYPDGMNAYELVKSSPATLTDPMGLQATTQPTTRPQHPVTVDATVSAEDRATIEAALDRVLNTKRGGQLADALRARKQVLVIETNSRRDFRMFRDTGTITIDPDPTHRPKLIFGVPDRRGRIVPRYMQASLERLLAHEIGHYYRDDDGPGGMNNINENENPIMRELGEMYDRIAAGGKS